MTIPKEAWPVVEEIREHVPKPKELPTTDWSRQETLGWVFGKCPMGFLPYASSSRPNNELDFDAGCPFGAEQTWQFWTWWDAQRDAQEAVAEVWDNPLSE